MSVLVLLSVTATAVSTVLFLALARSRGDRISRHGRASSVLRRASLPVVVVVAVALSLSYWISPTVLAWSALVVVAATVPWLPATRRWSAWAHTSWALTVVAGGTYIVAMAAWSLTSGLHGLALGGSWALWLLELVAYVLILSYAWEIHDALGSQSWLRRIKPAAASADMSGAATPFVSIHVPSHNEPPDMLINTLTALLRLDYPAYEVLVVDNNTTDDALCAPVQAFCAAHPEVLRFHRLLDWPGYKSGALNFAEKHSDHRAELIAVVDADYQVDPDWLRSTVGAFADQTVAFVQSPQDYREWAGTRYLRGLYYSYDYFFTVSQPSRDERNAAIFGGTMGLVRRSALMDVGGWDEWCVTEDAELSLRLLEQGWSGHHLDTAYGHGLMPLTFEALKRQRFRWCFGGMQILKRHWRDLMPWSRRTKLTLGQRMGYLIGGFQWFGDLVGLMFSLVVMGSLIDLAFGGGLVVRRLSGALLIAVPVLVMLGLVRAVAVLKAVGREATVRDAVGAYFVWLSLGWVVAMACVRGLVEPRGIFLRTPKVRGDIRWSDGARANVAELGLALLGSVSAGMALVLHPGWVAAGLTGLLVVPVVGWLAAPVHSVAAMRADLPAELRRRRAAEWSRGWWGPRTRLSLASALGAAVLTVLVVGLVQPTSDQKPTPAAVPSIERRQPTTPKPSTQGGIPTQTATGPSSSTTAVGSTTTPSTISSSTTPGSSSTLPATPAPTSTGSPTVRPTPTGSPTAPPTAKPTTPPGRPTTTPTGRP